TAVKVSPANRFIDNTSLLLRPVRSGFDTPLRQCTANGVRRVAGVRESCAPAVRRSWTLTTADTISGVRAVSAERVARKSQGGPPQRPIGLAVRRGAISRPR
ncbi:MAG: hypothetical protein D6744_07875, partial [Planctomycetota bacterium]